MAIDIGTATPSENIISTNRALPWGIGAGNFTVSIWVNPDSFSTTFAGVVSFLDATNVGQPTIFTSSTTTPNTWRASWEGTKTFNSALSAGVWTHLALRKVGAGANDLHGFFNGTQEANTYSGAGNFKDDGAWIIGSARTDAQLPMNGKVAESAIWDVNLTDAELSALAKGVSPFLIRPGHLVGYHPVVRLGTSDLIRGLGFDTTGAPVSSPHPRIFHPKLDFGSRRSFVHAPHFEEVSSVEVSIAAESLSESLQEATSNLSVSIFPEALAEALGEAVSVVSISIPGQSVQEGLAEGLSLIAIEIPAETLRESLAEPASSISISIPEEGVALAFAEEPSTVALSIPSESFGESLAEATSAIEVKIPNEALAESFGEPVAGVDILHPAPTLGGALNFDASVSNISLSIFPETLQEALAEATAAIGVAAPASSVQIAYSEATGEITVSIPTPRFGFSFQEQTSSIWVDPLQETLAEWIQEALSTIEILHPVSSPPGQETGFEDSVALVLVSAPESSTETTALAFISQRMRIQRRLISEAAAGPFYAVRTDPNTKQITVRLGAGSEIQPNRIYAEEVSSEGGIARSNRTEYRREKLSWTWELVVEFNEPASVEFFEARMAAKPPFLRDDPENNLEWVRLNWLDSRYEHPPQQQPSSGTRATMTFDAVLGPS